VEHSGALGGKIGRKDGLDEEHTRKESRRINCMLREPDIYEKMERRRDQSSYTRF
jgi:hypothetical protein